GPAMSALAAFFPARRAAAVSPLAGLSPRPVAEVERARRWPALGGLALLVLALAYEVALVRGGLSAETGGRLIPPFVALFLVGWGLVLPALLGPLLSAVARLARPLLGVEGRLALRNLQRRPARTGLTAGVIFIGLAVSVAFGTSFLTN